MAVPMKNGGMSKIKVIFYVILSGITIQGITHNGIFSNAKQAELENKRAQIVEYLRLKVINEQTNNPFGSAEEIITATRDNILENIKDLKEARRIINDSHNIDEYIPKESKLWDKEFSRFKKIIKKGELIKC